MRWIPAVLALLLAPPVGAGETQICSDPFFTVTAPDPALAERTCHSAAAARESLRTCGIELPEPLEIRVVDAIMGSMGPCLGVYHCGEQEIAVLSPDAMSSLRAEDGAFAGISDMAYWDSILVHELTHAAYDAVTCPFSSCVATSEYASYAMQVRSLPPEEQAKFGEQVELRSKSNLGAMSAMIYFMAPDKFAKHAWLHFSSLDDPCAYMSLIMDGKVFFDMEPL
jgi:hypothetical protein